MTVEAYLKSLVPGLDLPKEVYQRAARSPKEVGLDAVKLDDDIDAFDDIVDEDERNEAEAAFQVRLDYAASTVYYAVLGVFAGGGFTEQYGDTQMRKGGYTITMADRERFKMLADALRKKHGFDTEDENLETGGMFDGGFLRFTRGNGI